MLKYISKEHEFQQISHKEKTGNKTSRNKLKLPPVVLFITPAPYCHHVVSYIFSNNKYSSLPFTLVSINAVTFFNVYVGFSWINVSFSLELRVFASNQKTWINFDLAYYYKPLFYATKLLLGSIFSYFSSYLAIFYTT